MHRLDSSLRRGGIIVGDEAEALGQVGLFVDKHLGRDDAAKWHEGGRQVGVGKLLWQVIDEQVAPFRTCKQRRGGRGLIQLDLFPQPSLRTFCLLAGHNRRSCQ